MSIRHIVMHPMDRNVALRVAKVADCSIALSENWPADRIGFDGDEDPEIIAAIAQEWALGWKPILLP